MKKSSDPRHLHRRKIIKQLFAYSFGNKTEEQDHETKKIIRKRRVIDKQISDAAPAWPIDKVNRIDLAILRLAVFELENKDTPFKVTIDEAVELAKEYGSETSASFVNGVLGTILGKTQKEHKKIRRDESSTNKN